MEVRVDGNLIEGWHKQVSGTRLTCTAPSGVYIFEIPISEYEDLEEEIDRLDGQQVDMGVMPHLIVSGVQNTHVAPKPATFYDILTFTPEGIEGGRLSTGEDKPPYGLTLEEAKLLAALDVGASLEQTKGVKATIIPMTAWGTHGRFIIVGFCLDGDTVRRDDHTIMVNHCGHVSYSHGYSKEEFLPFFKRGKERRHRLLSLVGRGR